MARFDEGQYVAITPGKYRVRIADAAITTSKSGNEAMNIEWVVVTPGEFQGVSIKKTTPGWIVCKLASAIGLHKSTDENGKPYYDVDGVDLINKMVDVTITHREFPANSGKMYNEIGTDFVVVPVESGDDIPF